MNYFIFLRKRCLCFPSRIFSSDYSYNAGIEFLISNTHFFCTILHIIRSRAKKKVFRIGAGWIIASMQNMHSFWNSPMRKSPGNPMGS